MTDAHTGDYALFVTAIVAAALVVSFLAGFAVGQDSAMTGPGEPEGIHEPVHVVELENGSLGAVDCGSRGESLGENMTTTAISP